MALVLRSLARAITWSRPSNARFCCAFTRVGFIPDMALMFSLPHRVGYARAKQLIALAPEVKAEQAERIGLVDEVVEAGGALRRALELARQYAEAPPIAFALTKSVFARGLEEMIQAEVDLQPYAWLSADHEEGKLAFRENASHNFAAARRIHGPSGLFMSLSALIASDATSFTARCEHWYRTGYYRRETLAETLRRAVEARPATALNFHTEQGLRSVTALDVWNTSGALCRALQARGLRRGDVFALQLPTSFEAATLYVSAFRAGATVLPLVHNLGTADVDWILRGLGRYLVCHTRQLVRP